LGIHNKNTYQSLNVYRPLLNKWKDELITYCNKKHVIFGVDETNDSDLYERNRVRKALSLLSSSAKETEFQRVQCFNKEHRKERRTIHNEFNLWKYLSYDTTVFKDMLSKHKYYVVYIMLKNCDVNTINRDKIQLVIQWIEASHKNTKLRIDNDLYLQKIDDFIKVVKQ
jgi:tRNA(Ile)-lysidine synthase